MKTPERHLPALDRLQDLALAPDGIVHVGYIARETSHVLRILRKRMTSLYDRSRDERPDFRRMLRDHVRHPFEPLRPIYHARRRVSRLAVLVDVSESMLFYKVWMAAILLALCESGIKLRLFFFNTQLIEHEANGMTPTYWVNQLEKCASAGKPRWDILQLGQILERVRKEASGVKDIICISDCVCYRSETADHQARLAAETFKTMSAFEKFILLDPLHLGSLNESGDQRSVRASDIQRLFASLPSIPLTARVKASESDQHIMFSKLQELPPEQVVGNIPVADPFVRELKRLSAQSSGFFHAFSDAKLDDFIKAVSLYFEPLSRVDFSDNQQSLGHSGGIREVDNED